MCKKIHIILILVVFKLEMPPLGVEHFDWRKKSSEIITLFNYMH